MELYIVRHGETTFNQKKILQGYSVPSHLNDTGKEQAKKLALKLMNIDFDCIYSSDLERAVETSEIIIEKLNKKPSFIKCPYLRERNYGDFEGHNWSEIQKIINTRSALPNGESLYDVKDRIEKFIRELKENHNENENILAVTHHGGVIMLFICLLGLTLDNHKNFHFDNCSLSHFHIGEKYNKLILANSTFHI